MSEQEHFVEFDIRCPKCKHANESEFEDPCNDCLGTPVTETGMPINFEEK